MARKKDSPQKAALLEMMNSFVKENDVKVKDGTDVNSIILPSARNIQRTFDEWLVVNGFRHYNLHALRHKFDSPQLH